MTAKMPTHELDPDEQLDFGWDWRKKYLNPDDDIDTSTWDVPEPLEKIADTHDEGLTSVVIKGSADGLGELFKVTNTILTTGGRTAQRSFMIAVVQK